jgi:hypothetical protein
MNKLNLIRFGAIAQDHFKMLDNFEIIELPDDAPLTYRIPFRNPINIFIDIHDERPLPNIVKNYDEVKLIKFWFIRDFENIWAGYSARTNTLLIKDTNGGFHD